jgi:hypothetical protein
VIEEIVAIYISKGVSNMFLVTVIELLQRRLPTYSNNQIKKAIDDMLKGSVPLVNEVSHPKGAILRLDKSKYKEAMDHYTRQTVPLLHE